MNLNQIFDHWKSWATLHGTGLKATTKTPTAKMMELDVLARYVQGLGYAGARLLEVGCGNGANVVSLAKTFPACLVDGVDFVEEMVVAARESAAHVGVSDRTRFFVGNVLELRDLAKLAETYDVVFTDRCLINLNTTELQAAAISRLGAKVRPGGHMLLVENSSQTHGAQNHCRELLGLPPRPVAEFNFFFDEDVIIPHIEKMGFQVEVEDFISLHDLALYVLVPAINGGVVDYDHPLVHAATQLSIAVSAEAPGAFGKFGQNRLYSCRKAG